MEGWEDDGKKLKNTLPLYGNKDSMNLNSMILTNIVGSAYFKEELIQFKTFHEVIDEIYYKVSQLHHDFGCLKVVFFLRRLSTWSRGKKTVESWRAKLECVPG